MVDEPENLTLRMLRRMDAKLDRLIDVLAFGTDGGWWDVRYAVS